MDPRRIAFWMLAVAGVAVGHIAGYTIAHPDVAAREAALGGHASLPVAATVVVAFAVTRCVDLVRRAVRVVGGRRPVSRCPVPVTPFVPRLVVRSAVAPVSVGLRAPPVAGSSR